MKGILNTNDFSKSSQSGGFEYIVTGIEDSKKSSINTVFKIKLSRKVFGDHDFPKQFPKDLKLELRKWSYVDILGMNDEPLAHVVYHAVDIDDDNY